MVNSVFLEFLKFAPMPSRYAWIRCLSIVTMHRAQTDGIFTSSDYKNCSAVLKKNPSNSAATKHCLKILTHNA
jgi:hypothetical protein